MRNIVVNALGDQCPIPVVKATRALREMREPGTLEIHVDNEVAVQNLSRMASGHHLKAESRQEAEKHFVVTVAVDHLPETVEDAPVACTPAAGGSLVVAVDTDIMGRGND